MHEEKTITTLQHLVDGIIMITKEGNKLYLSLPLSPELPRQIQFYLTKRGIEVL